MSEFSLFSDIKFLIFVIFGTGGLSLITLQKNKTWKNTAKNAIILGVTGTIIKLLFLFGNLGSGGIKNVLQNLSLGLLPAIYGFVLLIGFMSLSWRFENNNILNKNNDKPDYYSKYLKLSGYILLSAAFISVLWGHSVSKLLISLPMIGVIFGGTIIIFILSRNKFSITPSLGFLGIIMVLSGMSKMLHAMGSRSISGVADSMQIIILALFYILIGLIFAGIPIDEFQSSKGLDIPLTNKVIYIIIPIISIGIYLFTFLVIITPLTIK